MEKTLAETVRHSAETRAVVQEVQRTLLGHRSADHYTRPARIEQWRSWLTGIMAILGGPVDRAVAILAASLKR